MFFLGTDSKILTFENEVSNIVMYHKQSREENRKAAFPPLPASPKNSLSI